VNSCTKRVIFEPCLSANLSSCIDFDRAFHLALCASLGQIKIILPDFNHVVRLPGISVLNGHNLAVQGLVVQWKIVGRWPWSVARIDSCLRRNDRLYYHLLTCAALCPPPTGGGVRRNLKEHGYAIKAFAAGWMLIKK
jgi:hypothetical protein